MDEVRIQLEKELQDTFKNASEEEVWRTKSDEAWRKVNSLEDENSNLVKMVQNLDLELKRYQEDRKQMIEMTERKLI